MIRISFDTNSINELQSVHTRHHHRFVRKKALTLLLKSRNLSHKRICEVVNISANTLRTYLRGYIARGINYILETKFYQPQPLLIPSRIQKKIERYLKKNPPSTIKQACAEINKLTGIKIGKTQMGHFLKALGFKFLKVGSLPAKANIDQQKQFLKDELKPLLKKARKGDCSVFFVDAAHFVLGSVLGYIWCQERLYVKTSSGRQRFNVLGALDAVTNELLSVANSTYITSTQVCELLELIASKAVKPTTVVLDNAKYQRCDLVMRKAEGHGIELLFLPTYSPNLNLIERLWKFVKKYCLSSKYYSDFKKFTEAIRSFLAGMHSKYTEELESLLTHKFQVLKKSQYRAAL